MGVSASAYFDWAQNPQSSAHPPLFAFTSEHMSVDSPKLSCRTIQATSTSRSMSSCASSSPSSSASSKLIKGGIPAQCRRAFGRADESDDQPVPERVLRDDPRIGELQQVVRSAGLET